MAPLSLLKDGAIARIVIDRPGKQNAFDAAMWDTLTGYCGDIAKDPEVKIVTIESAFEKAFSAGADISEFDELRKDPKQAEANMAKIESAMAAVEALRKPTIAVIDGSCFGGGLALALCCDFRVAGSSARFAITPAKLGLTYSLLNVNRLAAVAGHQMARRLLMLGEVVKPDLAVQTGLVDRMSEGCANEALTELVDRLLALSQYSLRSIKQTIQLSERGATGFHADDHARLIAAFDGPDLAEGMTAFLEKRPAKFPFR